MVGNLSSSTESENDALPALNGMRGSEGAGWQMADGVLGQGEGAGGVESAFPPWKRPRPLTSRQLRTIMGLFSFRVWSGRPGPGSHLHRSLIASGVAARAVWPMLACQARGLRAGQAGHRPMAVASQKGGSPTPNPCRPCIRLPPVAPILPSGHRSLPFRTSGMSCARKETSPYACFACAWATYRVHHKGGAQ
jgi:hypothetical protein